MSWTDTTVTLGGLMPAANIRRETKAIISADPNGRSGERVLANGGGGELSRAATNIPCVKHFMRHAQVNPREVNQT